MMDYVKKMIGEFEYELPKSAKTPEAEHLLKINNKCEKLNEKLASDFHTFTSKGLFVCKRGRPDVQTAIAFLTTQVKEPDHDDWKKLMWMMTYLRNTKSMVLTLEADDLKMM